MNCSCWMTGHGRSDDADAGGKRGRGGRRGRLGDGSQRLRRQAAQQQGSGSRVRSLLRSRERELDDRGPVRVRDLTVDPARHEVWADGKLVPLTPTEFNILYMLAKHPGIVFTRYEILDKLHGSDYLVTDRAVDVQIVGLRRKLGSCGGLVQTIRGVGYRLRE
jgi:DNA-binding response OmpR family regulator